MVEHTDDRTADRTVTRRRLLKGTGAALAGGVGVATVTAAPDDPLIVEEFDGEDVPATNALDNWTTATAFESASVRNDVLVLEYDDAGFYASRVEQSVEEYSHLVLGIRGTDGADAEDIQIEIGGQEALLSAVAETDLTESFARVAVDLEAMGVADTVDDVRLNCWQGGSGTLELAWVAFAPSADPSISLPGESTTTTTPDDPEAWPWEVEAGNEKEPTDPIPVEEVDADTTVAELCPTFDDSENAHLHIDRTLAEYIPDEAADPDDADVTETNLSDEEKAGLYDVDLDALSSGAGDGSVALGDLGTQTLDHVRTYLENGFPYHATAKLLPRLMLLPEETEPQPYHKGGDPWSEQVEAAQVVNDPDPLVQQEWPTDARSYDADEKYERDRAHDQPDHEDGWTNGTPGEEVYADEDHPLLDAIETHPMTGEDLTGGFTANAPMEARIKMHSDSGDYWYQVLDFKNTQSTPFYIDAAIIWWVGPSSLSTLRNGHYNNAHRPQTGYGHPQRDIIEVIYDRDRALSAYAVRIAQHDEPYRMRTAYPNQWWGLEQGGPASDPIDGGSRYTSSDQRQDVVETMWNTLHVELETNLDRNNELHDTLQLRNRVSN
ncbi:MAG: hypothetical protein ACOCYZ_05140 [Halococcoides sp.]